nr:synaptobrevin, longin-like domain protein [Tanacetum cinerariifolium]
MIAILEKYELNTDFHQIVDFVEASHLRYALTFNPTIYVSHIRQFWSTARIETMDEGTKILATVDGQFSHQWKYLIHIIMQCLSPKSIGFNEFSSNIATALVCLATNRVYSFSKMIFDGMVRNVNNKVFKFLMYPRRARIAQSSALPPAADEPASPIGDDSQGEACHTDSGLAAEQDRANITKTSTLSSDSTPRVTSFTADEGSMQQKLNKLTNLYTRLQRQQDEMASKITTQDLEIATLKARVKLLEDRDGAVVLFPLLVYLVLEFPLVVFPLASDVVPTASPIFTTATVATPYTRRKGKEKMVEFDTPKKKKLQEQIDVQVARELEEKMARDAQRMNEQIARDAEIARIHAEEELQMMIDGLDRNNESVAKYLQEYHHFAAELPIGRKIELISDLVKYQDNYAKVLKFQTQQRKPLLRKQQREFYMSALRSHAEEGERFKRKRLRLEQDSAKKVKISEEVPKENLKEMMQLIPVEEHFDREDLNQLWALVKETLNIKQATSDKEKELWVELKRLYEPDVEDLLWTHTQNMMHAPVEWKLYDMCGVHHVISKDQEMSMLVEKDYPLRKGLAIVMISYKLQGENYSQMANDLILKIHKIANSPRQQDD